MVKGRGIFYGWWIIATGFLILFLGAGIGFYSFGVLLKPLMNEFGWSRGVASLGQSIYFFSSGVTGFFVGRLVGRYSVKKIVFIGAGVSGICFLLLSLTPDLWYFYLLYFVIGSGMGGAGMVSVMVTISKWFTRKRGTAMGIATAGIAVGAMVLTPTVGMVVENFGWRVAYLFLGSIVLLIDLPIAAFVLRANPEEMGLLPDGDQLAVAKPNATTKLPATNRIGTATGAGQVGLSSALRSLPLWLLCLGFGLVQLSEMSIMLHEASFITDMGIPVTTAAAALGFTGGVGGLGKLAFGWLADKLSTRYVTILCFAVQLAGVLILMQTNSMAMVWLFVVVFGFSMGGAVTLIPLTIGDIFGATSLGTLFGLVNLVVSLCSLFGPSLAGFIFDARGSYDLVFIIASILYIISITAVYFAFGANPKMVKSAVKA